MNLEQFKNINKDLATNLFSQLSFLKNENKFLSHGKSLIKFLIGIAIFLVVLIFIKSCHPALTDKKKKIIEFFENFIFKKNNKDKITALIQSKELADAESTDSSDAEEDVNIDNKKAKRKKKHITNNSDEKGNDVKEKNIKRKNNGFEETDECDNESNLLSSDEESVAELDDWKKNEWIKWMDQTEEEWQLLKLWLEGEKNKWLEGKNKEYDIWLKHMDSKWTNYSKDIDEEYGSNLFKDSHTWNEKQWEKWMKTEGKEFMLQDFKRWLEESEGYLKSWLVKQWIQWKNMKILEWLMNEWRREEDEKWSLIEDTDQIRILNHKDRKEWLKWKERVTREKLEWKHWVELKENMNIYNKWKKWIKWKKNRLANFNEWSQNFIEKWIRDKQWNVWINERKTYTSQRKSLEQQFGDNIDSMNKLRKKKILKYFPLFNYKSDLESIVEVDKSEYKNIDENQEQKGETTLSVNVEKTEGLSVEKTVDLNAAKTSDPNAEKTVDLNAAKTSDSNAEKTVDLNAAKTSDSNADKTGDVNLVKTTNYNVGKTTDQKVRHSLDQEVRQMIDQKVAQIINLDIESTTELKAEKKGGKAKAKTKVRTVDDDGNEINVQI
ncbi:tryptophan/threonine-rich antigen [Plasmodium sp. DRC-Itaito]|nr:tryptophan/threonine-rich antigen [Plasmodium sp. DRC-Itaito]